MKSAMVQHVETASNTMFHQATATVKELLDAICGVVATLLKEKTGAVITSVYRDYRVELIGMGPVNRQDGVLPCELELRASVRTLLQDVDSAFTLLPRGDGVNDEAPEEEPAEPIQDPVSRNSPKRSRGSTAAVRQQHRGWA